MLGKDKPVLDEKGAKYLSISHYAKGNLSPHYNKSFSSHSFHPFSDFYGSLQRRAHFHRKIMKGSTELVKVKFKG